MTENAPDSEADERSPSAAGRLLVQFFVVPLFVVGVAVAVFWLFGSLALDKKGPSELLEDVKTGSRNQRWQSAFELTRRLPPPTDPVARAAFAQEVVRAYEGAGSDDPRVRRYLALVLGRLGATEAVPLLESALSDPDAETRLYALWSLALVAEPASAPKVRPFLHSDDAGMRKTAAYAAGRMVDGEAVPTLTALLQDPVVDVRWNAALALAALAEPAGRDVLLSMTDRAALRKIAGLTTDQEDEAVLNGLRGLRLLKDARAEEIARRLVASDPSPRVRRELRALSEEARQP